MVNIPRIARWATLNRMAVSDLDLALPDAAATEALGVSLAATFPGAERASAGLYLEGDLGAGKTTCVRAFLRACGVSGLIRSPTYTLVETYRLDGRTPPLTCVHIDLYRLEGAVQVDELGMRDFLRAGHLLLVEWAQKGAGSLPLPDVELFFEFAASARHARLRAGTARGEAWLDNLRDDTRIASYLSNLT
jgi:tRNA threonylcarbamoyladenosine biosynthesis protein TsaE